MAPCRVRIEPGHVGSHFPLPRLGGPDDLNWPTRIVLKFTVIQYRRGHIIFSILLVQKKHTHKWRNRPFFFPTSRAPVDQHVTTTSGSTHQRVPKQRASLLYRFTRLFSAGYLGHSEFFPGPYTTSGVSM